MKKPESSRPSVRYPVRVSWREAYGEKRGNSARGMRTIIFIFSHIGRDEFVAWLATLHQCCRGDRPRAALGRDEPKTGVVGIRGGSARSGCACLPSFFLDAGDMVTQQLLSSSSSSTMALGAWPWEWPPPPAAGSRRRRKLGLAAVPPTPACNAAVHSRVCVSCARRLKRIA